MHIADHFQHEDWKTEKHVPVIDMPEAVRSDEPFQVTVSLGKEVDHPNTVDHHIRWVRLYFMPEGDGLAHEVGSFEFCAHGESAGDGRGPVHTHHTVTCTMQVAAPGHLVATAYCNIHGLWENSARVRIAS
jgi:superoxide reductase